MFILYKVVYSLIPALEVPNTGHYVIYLTNQKLYFDLRALFLNESEMNNRLYNSKYCEFVYNKTVKSVLRPIQ